MMLYGRRAALLFAAVALVLTGCGRFGKVPRGVIERQIGLDHPALAGKIEKLSTEIYGEGPRGADPVTDADRANGVDARYVVRWTAITRDEKGVAADLSGANVFTHLSSGEWVTYTGIFDADGHPALTEDVSGTYRGRYTHYDEHLDCTMTLGAAPDYAGSYECSGKQWRSGFDATLVPARFTGSIALFAVFQPDSAPMKARLLDGPMHIINPDRRYTRAVVLASDARSAWQVAERVEEHGSALGVGFSTSGINDSFPPLFFEKVQNGRSHAEAPPSSETSSVVAPVTVANAARTGSSPSTETTYQPPGPTSVPVPETAAAEELPGRPYPDPPTDVETRAAINAFLGEVTDGRQRSIEILGYRKLCAEPVGSECYLTIDGKQRKVFTLQRKSDGRIEATDLGSCGD
jgi:hypothetical protein